MAFNLARKCCQSNEVFELAFPRTGDALGSISGGVLLGGKGRSVLALADVSQSAALG